MGNEPGIPDDETGASPIFVPPYQEPWQYLKLPPGAAIQERQTSRGMQVEMTAPSIDPTLFMVIKTIVRALNETHSAK
jgi:hypothetical protein